MSRDLNLSALWRHLEKEEPHPFYLFYGQDEFRKERALERIKEILIPESARELNYQVFYADEASPLQILESARSMPFLFERRLVVVRRTDAFSPKQTAHFLPYLDDPSPSTCLIFLAESPDFRQLFFKRLKESGVGLRFDLLRDEELLRWLKAMAQEMKLKISLQACAHLVEIVGNKLMDLYSELEKLAIAFPGKRVGVEEVKTLAIHSRSYSIFQLVDEIFHKRIERALIALDGFLQGADREALLRIIGMMNRQVRLLWQLKWLGDEEIKHHQIAKKLGVPPFSVRRLIQQARLWRAKDLEEIIGLLSELDAKMKSGSQARLLLENLIVKLCV